MTGETEEPRPPGYRIPGDANIEALLDRWLQRSIESQKAHYETTKRLGRWHYLLGVPVVVLTMTVAATIFSTLGRDVAFSTEISLGLVSIAATVLAAVQTFLRLSERAEKHRSAGAGYGVLRRQIEHEIARLNSGGKPKGVDVKSIRERYDLLAQASPEIPERIWNRIVEDAG